METQKTTCYTEEIKKYINLENYYSIFDHPNKNCMSYLEHAKLSLTFSGMLFVGSIKAFIHAVIPDVYSKSTTDLIQEIDSMISKAGCHKKKIGRAHV